MCEPLRNGAGTGSRRYGKQEIQNPCPPHFNDFYTVNIVSIKTSRCFCLQEKKQQAFRKVGHHRALVYITL